MLLIFFFLTPDKRQASDVRGNSCTQTLSLEAVSHVAVPALLSVWLGEDLEEQSVRARQCQLTGPWRTGYGLARQCFLDEPQVTEVLPLQKGHQHS